MAIKTLRTDVAAGFVTKGTPLTNSELDQTLVGINDEALLRALKTGDTFTGKVSFAAATTGYASIRIQPGVAPTMPVSGDFWFNSGQLNFSDGTSTQILATQGDAIAFAIALG